ncbi:S49 family peptidase [Alkalicaulis satelles]|uniref:S49 family peptidase n=1 Tax=Alkalicaulis satelles TaxID=2609175 RepID=A0A5M6ZCX6_9PROT|nr:S49 family peptidase [Alkalicaulis satelles]KAA5802165.1 S49 family peptidase [Alkalicaulis satelles]
MSIIRDELARAARALRKLTGANAPRVPLVRLEGMIAAGGRNANALSLNRLEKLLDKAFADRDAAAVAITINSPGGSAVQSRLIHDRIRALAAEKEKTVLVFCEDVAASGGYWIACAGDEIFADPASIIGSIGVISAGFGFTGAMEKLGVERRVKTAGKSKLLADPFGPETEEQAATINRLMGAMHEQFIAHVKARRDGKLKDGAELFDGSVHTGSEALELGLIDALGEARSELKKRFGDKVVIRPLAPSRLGVISRLTSSALDHLELRALWARFGL